MISSTLDTINFVGLPSILENYITGCHGNHAFSHSSYHLYLEDNFVFHLGSPDEQTFLKGCKTRLIWCHGNIFVMLSYSFHAFSANCAA